MIKGTRYPYWHRDVAQLGQTSVVARGAIACHSDIEHHIQLIVNQIHRRRRTLGDAKHGCDEIQLLDGALTMVEGHIDIQRAEWRAPVDVKASDQIGQLLAEHIAHDSVDLA